MNNPTDKPESGEVLREYDFKGKKGVRGKYYRAYRQGHTVKIRRDDGIVTVRYFRPEKGTGRAGGA